MALGQDKAWDHAWEILKQFEKEYPFGQYGQYLCGISKVYLQTAEISEGEGENYCIKITITHPLPAELKFPEKYQEVRVFVGIDKPIAD